MRRGAARRSALAGAALLLLLAGCGEPAPPAPPSMSKSEAEALEDAAEMIDERRLPPEALASEPAASASPAQ